MAINQQGLVHILRTFTEQVRMPCAVQSTRPRIHFLPDGVFVEKCLRSLATLRSASTCCHEENVRGLGRHHRPPTSLGRVQKIVFMYDVSKREPNLCQGVAQGLANSGECRADWLRETARRCLCCRRGCACTCRKAVLLDIKRSFMPYKHIPQCNNVPAISNSTIGVSWKLPHFS